MKDKFPWLHYDELNDRAFCHTCIAAHNKEHMSTATNTIEPTFISTGYTNWKDALVKKEVLQHMSNYIVINMQSCMCIVTIPATAGDVGELISKKYAEEKAVPRQCLLKVLSNIHFLATQVLPNAQ